MNVELNKDNKSLYVIGLIIQSCCYCIKGWKVFFDSSADEMIENNTAGYLLRTKSEKTNEGGFYDGHSSIDTPQLVDDKEMISFLSNNSTTDN